MPVPNYVLTVLEVIYINNRYLGSQTVAYKEV